MPVIRISDDTWGRLKRWAVPLEDTPDDVIKRLLDSADRQQGANRRVWNDGREESQNVGVNVSPNKQTTRLPRGRRVPQSAYEKPILEALYELGGKAPGRAVLDLVESKMRSLLNEVDYEALPSGALRWRKTANWARNELVHGKGLLRDDSPRGIWELTEEGMKMAEKR